MNFFSRDAGANGLRIVLLVSCLCPALALPAAEIRLLALEQVSATESAPPQTRGSTPGLRLRLAGTSRQVDLLLEPNTTLLAGGRAGATEAFRGIVPGAPGSWARLTRRAGHYQGVYSDGRELFIVDAARNLSRSSSSAALLDPAATVVYRLADLKITGVVLTGDTVASTRSAAELYAQIAATLNPGPSTAVLTTRRLDVQLLADAELVALDGVDTQANAIARLSIVDGIFSPQLGVQMRLAGFTQFDASTEPFTASDPTALLGQVKSVRSGSAVQQASGLTFLFTGRALDGQTVGISYVGSLCSPSFGAALSQARTSVAFDALIAAHEIGHSFGAPHDADPAGACAATPDATYLMAARLDGSSTFSPCSLQVMTAFMATVSCLAQIDAADATFEVPAASGLALDQPTTVSFGVRSVGNSPVNDVTVKLTAPPDVLLNGGGAVGGSCSASGGTLNCLLGTLAAGESRDVQVSLTGTQPGSSVAALQVAASNDGLAQNNSSQLTLTTAPGADLSVSLKADATSVTVGQGATLRLNLGNAGLTAVSDAQLTLLLPVGATLRSVSATGIACAVTAGALQCPPASLAVGAQASVLLQLSVDQPGALAVSATFSSPTLTDPQPINNSASLQLTASAPASAQAISAGGGGRIGELTAGLLGLWLWSRCRRAAARRGSP